MKKVIVLTFLCLFSINEILATTYTTTRNGNYNAGSVWSPSKPPTTLPAGDFIIINHAVNLNKDVTIYGQMTINTGASLIGSKKLKIGEGSTTGALINNGTIDVVELTIKGDDTVANAMAPSINNTGIITTDKLHVGDNSAAGILINTTTGVITVNGELHADNIVDNAGTMTVTGLLKNHGGTVQGGGSIAVCAIEFDENTADDGTTRPGTLLDQNICCDFDNSDEPSFAIKNGTTYPTLDLLFKGESLISSDHFIDGVEFYSCGLNAQGDGLPVELVDFRVEEDGHKQAIVSWTTASEINNKFFAIERSIDGRNFETLGVVDGAGTTENKNTYSFVDRLPATFAYYRLKHVDYDGVYEFSSLVSLELKSFKSDKITLFPTIVENEVTMRFTTFETRKSILRIINSYGQTIHQEDVNSSEYLEYRTFDVSDFENGIYTVILSDGQHFSTSHFVVMKSN